MLQVNTLEVIELEFENLVFLQTPELSALPHAESPMSPHLGLQWCGAGSPGGAGWEAPAALGFRPVINEHVRSGPESRDRRKEG